MIFSSSFLRTIWHSTSMCLVLLWNTTFSVMYIVALLSPIVSWDTLGETKCLSINLWSRLALMSHLSSPSTLTFHWIQRSHSDSCLFMTQYFLQERHNILWSTSCQKGTLLSLHQIGMLLGYVHSLNRRAFSLELSSDTSKFSLLPLSG